MAGRPHAPPEMRMPAGGPAPQGTKESSTEIIGDEGQLGKLKARTAAEFALLGFGLVELADGTFLATRWTCCKPLVDLAAARAFLRQIGGGRA